MNCTPIIRHNLTIGGAFSMSKFTIEDKLNAVVRYMYGTESLKDISESVPVDHALLRVWIQQYKHHVKKAFEKRYTSYTLKYKLDVLNYMSDNGTSIHEKR